VFASYHAGGIDIQHGELYEIGHGREGIEGFTPVDRRSYVRFLQRCRIEQVDRITDAGTYCQRALLVQHIRSLQDELMLT